ncbi:unnamed protein product [Sympodiomycopsis kandeliae]
MAPKKSGTEANDKRQANDQGKTDDSVKKQKTDEQAPRRSARQASQSKAPQEQEVKPKKDPKKSTAKSTATKKNVNDGKKSASDDKKPSSDSKTKKEKPASESKPSSNSKSSDKKQTYGSKHDSVGNPEGTVQASKDKLPKKDETVHWKAMPGWVTGSVIEIVTEGKEVQGKSVKASKDDPRIVLKSHGPSGKIAVHKPEAVYFKSK